MIENVYLPYRAYWCTPFSRWQGSLAHLHSVRLAAHVTQQALGAREMDPENFDYGVLGLTIPQQNSFYGLPWMAGLLGAAQISGPTIGQACATSARVMACAADEVEMGRSSCVLAVTTDRTSNGPHIYYPAPEAPGGTGAHENWVLDNFSHDPLAKCDMLQTAENCAERWQVSREEQNALVLRRYEQYEDALVIGEDGCFQDRYMLRPLDIPDARFQKTIGSLEGDEGIYPTTQEGLDKLKPVRESGTVTYGTQTHPADGCAGMVITDCDKAQELSQDAGIKIRLMSIGQSRVELTFMPSAPIKAAADALSAANITIRDVVAIKSHNPFAVNDIIFARETGADLETMNNFGCSLIWGHPQGPTGMRAIIELIEELVMKGGGYGLFHGCAAGDTAMAVVIKVGE
ncbi:MAG: acetyl-CoA acetyltransferase [Woeseia sp.]|nr:acetyl-CoA acetyltransferase [Woeseia sp.]